MNSKIDSSNVTFVLNKDEAIVFSEWLNRFTLEITEPNEAYQRVLYDLDAVLEKLIPEILDDNYQQVLE